MLLSGKFDFDPEEVLDKSLLFDSKKASEEKKFDSILEKIPDKNNIYYTEHSGVTNAFRIRKDSKQDEKRWTKNNAWNVNRGIKRATSKSKLSQLKRIEKQLIRNTKIWGKSSLTMIELKNPFKNL